MYKKIFAFICCIGFFTQTSFATANEAEACRRISGAVGDWSGILDFQGIKLTLVLHVQENESGVLEGKVDCLEQGIKDLAADTITEEASIVKFEIKNIAASYYGYLNTDETEISGKFTQGNTTITLNLNRGNIVVAELKRPQEPKPPFPYIVEEVSYESSAEGVTLSGTLTLPNGTGPFPAVVLVAGSGPNDRNEALLGHKPFLVLSDHLTKNGIAVLRFDKRGVGKSTGNYEAATSEDFTNDALAGIAYLKTRGEVDSEKMGLIGHSEGGLIAPMAAAQSNEIAFIVMLAGPGVNGEEILYQQTALIHKSLGTSSELIAGYRDIQQKMFEIVKTEPDHRAAEDKLKAIGAAHADFLEKLHLDQKTFEAQAVRINNPWFRHFLVFDPITAIKHVSVPVLVLNGALDIQVDPDQNIPPITQALAESGNPDSQIVVLPKLNHLFQTCETGAIAEYVQIEETFAPAVLELITEWITKRTF
jgi:hypothetical protein